MSHRVRRIVLVALTLFACGCAGTHATSATDATLGLKRDRYVLPPEPAPPRPRPVAELRALEAEWPPVSASAAWPTIRRVRPTYGFPGPLPECGTPQAEGHPCVATMRSSGSLEEQTVYLRVEARSGGPPDLLIEER